MTRGARPPREARAIGLEHRKRYLYAAAWLPYLTFYLAGFVANGVPLGFAIRNALATGLPDALLGVAVLRIPRRLPWPEGRRTRFFAAHLGFLAAFLLGSAAGWVVLVNLDSLLFKGSLGVRINAGILPWRALNDALSGASRSEPPARPADEGRRLDPERQLVALKAQVMSADYRGDLAELARLRDRAARLADDPKLGYLARYWAGFASWRLAINGTGMTPAELKAHMEKATADFDAAIRLRDDFADAYAAASMCHAWLAFVAKDPATAPQHAESSKRQGARAKELAPGNPRVLWMEGARLFYTPVDFGGNPQRAIEVYRQMAAASEGAAAPNSPLPDWGKPEALMSLANAHLSPATLDLAAAAAEAQEALRLAPEWHYVRDILIPMIEARRKQAGKPAGSGP